MTFAELEGFLGKHPSLTTAWEGLGEPAAKGPHPAPPPATAQLDEVP